MKKCLFLFALPWLWSCADMDYDISKGIDPEFTLFSDEISVPVGNVGPVSLGILLDGTGLRETINEYVQEDADGFLVLEKEEQVYQNFVMLFSMMLPDPSMPVDFPAGRCTVFSQKYYFFILLFLPFTVNIFLNVVFPFSGRCGSFKKSHRHMSGGFPLCCVLFRFFRQMMVKPVQKQILPYSLTSNL